MILSKYINWPELWDEEVSLEAELDEIENDEHIQIIKQFLNDDDVNLDFDECVETINK
jgi:hypothetical protein